MLSSSATELRVHRQLHCSVEIRLTRGWAGAKSAIYDCLLVAPPHTPHHPATTPSSSEYAGSFSAQLRHARYKHWVCREHFDRQIPDHCLNVNMGRALPDNALSVRWAGTRGRHEPRQHGLGRHKLKVKSPTQRHCRNTQTHMQTALLFR